MKGKLYRHLMKLDNIISKFLNYMSLKRKNKNLKGKIIDLNKEVDDLRDTVAVITLELHNQKNINTRLAKERNNLQIEVNGLRECQNKKK